MQYKSNKNNLVLFTKVISRVFILSTIILLFIFYKEIDINIDIKFIILYVLLAFFIIIYLPVVAILKLKRFTYTQKRQKLFKFIKLLILFIVLNCGFEYVFKNQNIDLINAICNALGASFGICYMDVVLKE